VEEIAVGVTLETFVEPSADGEELPEGRAWCRTADGAEIALRLAVGKDAAALAVGQVLIRVGVIPIVGLLVLGLEVVDLLGRELGVVVWTPVSAH
jgi:hypothetical protein